MTRKRLMTVIWRGQEIEVEATIQPAEPDVGIMSEWAESFDIPAQDDLPADPEEMTDEEGEDIIHQLNGNASLIEYDDPAFGK